MKHIKVVAAILFNKGEILCTQRPDNGEAALKWEFPGGKIEPSETPEQALVREIKEELGCDITVNDFLMTVKHQYKSFHLTMHCYKCTLNSDNITLHEHVDSCWLPINEMNKLDWAPADIPVVHKLQENL